MTIKVLTLEAQAVTVIQTGDLDNIFVCFNPKFASYTEAVLHNETKEAIHIEIIDDNGHFTNAKKYVLKDLIRSSIGKHTILRLDTFESK